MKLSLFKKLIREVIREELEYSLRGLRKELKEVVVTGNNDNTGNARAVRTEDTSFKNMMSESPSSNPNSSITNSNITVPQTNNKVLNSLLTETAQSDDWKQVNSWNNEDWQKDRENMLARLQAARLRLYEKAIRKGQLQTAAQVLDSIGKVIGESVEHVSIQAPELSIKVESKQDLS